MKKIYSQLILFTTVVTATSTYAVTAHHRFHDEIEALLENKLPHARVGIVVADAETGKIIYDHDGYHNFLPASNVKLFTAAASLYSLGPEYRFTTSIFADKKKIEQGHLNDNLYIKFTGDPSLKAEHLTYLVSQIKQNGIDSINGNIVLDSTIFTGPTRPPGWAFEDKHWYYSAPISAIIINQNAQGVNLSPNQQLYKTAATTLENSAFKDFVTLKSNVTTVNQEEAKKHCQLEINVDHENNISLSGCWPMSTQSKYMKVALQNPERIAQQLLKNEFKKAGISFSGQFTIAKTPSKANLIAQHKSEPLKTLLYTLMKDSNNVYAESLTKTLAYKISKKGTFQEGVNAISQILSEKTEIDFDELMLFDGSGQSRYDLITPHQFVRLLHVVYNSPDIKNYYLSALPVSGKNGTLKYRLNSFDLQNHVQAKTGTLKGSTTLSGYITTKRKHKLVFSILINDLVKETKIAKHVQAKILSIIWGQA